MLLVVGLVVSERENTVETIDNLTLGRQIGIIIIIRC